MWEQPPVTGVHAVLGTRRAHAIPLLTRSRATREPGYSKCWSHTAKESVANCVKFKKNTLELTVDYRPWRGSMLKAFLRRQMGTQLAPSIQLCQYKGLKWYAKEVGIFPTVSGWMKWRMNLCMNRMLHFPMVWSADINNFLFWKRQPGKLMMVACKCSW